MSKVRINAEKVESKEFSVSDLIVSVLTGGLYAIVWASEPDYKVTLETDQGEFCGEGNTLEEAREKAWEELKRRL